MFLLKSNRVKNYWWNVYIKIEQSSLKNYWLNFFKLKSNRVKNYWWYVMYIDNIILV